jgi:glucose-1-phosphate thymidylyltransferase
MVEKPTPRINQQRVIGLLPAAGHATRLGPLPCSKEIYPIGSHTVAGAKEARPKVAGHYLLEKMQRAGITEAFIIIREGKWDILAQFKDGAMLDMHLGYLVVTVPWGAPYTLDQAYPFVRNDLVALGFPDILFSADDAYDRILAHHARARADVVLGLFPADRPSTMDVVDLADGGLIMKIIPKPVKTTLKHTWGIAVWAPPFTEFLHDYLARRPVPTETQSELFVGNVIQAGIESGLNVEGIHVSDKPFIDIGIRENLARALREDFLDQS